MDINTKEQIVALARKLSGMVAKKQALETVAIPAQNIRLMCDFILEASGAVAPKEPLTAQQKDCLQAIIDLTAELNQPPSLRQIAARLGIEHHNTANVMVKNLIEKGYLERSGKDKMLKVLSRP